MEIRLSERELHNICNNVTKQVARLVQDYLDEKEDCCKEEGIVHVEPSFLIEEILDMKVEFHTTVQPKEY